MGIGTIIFIVIAATAVYFFVKKRKASGPADGTVVADLGAPQNGKKIFPNKPGEWNEK